MIFNLKKLDVRAAGAALGFAIAAMLAAPAHAQTNPAAAGIAAANLANSIGGTATVSHGGTSESNAQSIATSQATLAANTATQSNAAATGLTGVINQSVQNSAWNYKTGGGTGTSDAAGSTNGGVIGISNIANIGVLSVPVNGLTLTGLTGNLAGAGTVGASLTDSIHATTNQGANNVSSATGTFGVATSAQTNGAMQNTLNDNGTVNNGVALSSTLSGDIMVSQVSRATNLQTGAPGTPLTPLGTATVTQTASGSFQASAGGAAAVVSDSGTSASLANAIAPGLTQLNK